MTSKTGIRVGRPFLVTTMLFRSPCRTRVRRSLLEGASHSPMPPSPSG